MASAEYEAFLASKDDAVTPVGIEVQPSSKLFPFQRDIVRWAMKRGRAAVFADCGMGKTAIQLDWASHVPGRVLILAPLAVAEQTVREGAKFGVEAVYLRADDGVSRIVVTNYEMLEHFDPASFAGVVLDESSILKAYDGKTRSLIIAAFNRTPYRLACTATPAPNDFTELGNHSEFLGIRTRTEMLAEYFVHDGGSTTDWRLKGHAQSIFWRWVCSWACMIRKPSDLGYSDEGFTLPPLRFREHIIEIGHEDAWKEGMLFAPEVKTLADQRATRRMTLDQRIEAIARVANETAGPVLVWCELNAESEGVAAAIPGAVEVAGSDSNDVKADRLLGFAEGRYRVLVTKPSIAGFGMNWQHCATVVFAGSSHSYEQTYQAVRRCWRFGQKSPVDVHFIRTDTEGPIAQNMKRKEADAARMASEMVVFMAEIQRAEIAGTKRMLNDYRPSVRMEVPSWMS